MKGDISNDCIILKVKEHRALTNEITELKNKLEAQDKIIKVHITFSIGYSIVKYEMHNILISDGIRNQVRRMILFAMKNSIDSINTISDQLQARYRYELEDKREVFRKIAMNDGKHIGIAKEKDRIIKRLKGLSFIEFIKLKFAINKGGDNI